ncbi:hypothetical protein ACFL6H_03550 [Candidatus Latescibacterota bacterium]
MIEILKNYKKKVVCFNKDAHSILSKHESSLSRLVTIEDTHKKLTNLSLQQNNLFEEALNSIKASNHRAAHVMAWAAYIDYLEEKLASDGLKKIFAKRPKWSKFITIDIIRENIPEYQLIEVAYDVGLLPKTQKKIIHGLLSKRNECAHPSGYKPGLNESLGYISELLQRIEYIQKKSY